MILKIIIKYLLVALLVLFLGGAMYQYVVTKLIQKKYAPIGTLIDIGGYKLHMIDSAQNYDAIKPVVVLDSGIGSTTFDWLLVQPEIAKFARVISYDRAGYGWSDESPLPRTSENIVRELHSMLHNACVQGPYILVGHSFGGMNVRLFAVTYPDEVAGIVLVDAVHESVMEKIPQVFIGFKHWIYRKLLASYLGIPCIASNITSWMHPDKDVRRNVDRLHKTTTQYYRTLFHQLDLMSISCEQMKAARTSLPNIPVTVITEGKQVIAEHGPCGTFTQDEVQQINATWLELQADLVTQFPQGKQIIAQHSGHNIPYEQPQIIVEAVQAMCRKAL